MLLSLKENELGWSSSITEFKKDIFSRAYERFKEGFSEISHQELTFSEIKFVTFLSLAVQRISNIFMFSGNSRCWRKRDVNWFNTALWLFTRLKL